MQKIVIISLDEAQVITKITQALDEAGVNIKSLDTERIGEQSIISLNTHNADLALRALARGRIPCRSELLPGKGRKPPKGCGTTRYAGAAGQSGPVP